MLVLKLLINQKYASVHFEVKYENLVSIKVTPVTHKKKQKHNLRKYLKILT